MMSGGGAWPSCVSAIVEPIKGKVPLQKEKARKEIGKRRIGRAQLSLMLYDHLQKLVVDLSPVSVLREAELQAGYAISRLVY